MLNDLLLATVDFLSGHVYFMYIVGAFIGLIESIPVFGTFAPATPLLLAFGTIAGLDETVNVYVLVFLVVVGCIVSDWIGFYLGQKSTRFFKPGSRFLKAAHVEKGEAFFRKYGSWSVLIGRFMGPLRPIIPFAAGLSNMDRKKFWIFNSVSALLWAPGYIIPGYLLGYAVSDIDSLDRVFFYISGGVIGFYIVTFCLYHFFIRHLSFFRRSS